MNRREFGEAASLFALMSASGYALSDEVEDDELSEMTREERREAWEDMSEEEHNAIREQMRERARVRREEYEAMTPEERAARREEMRERFEGMSPEERQAMRERFRARGPRGRKPPESNEE